MTSTSKPSSSSRTKKHETSRSAASSTPAGAAGDRDSLLHLWKTAVADKFGSAVSKTTRESTGDVHSSRDVPNRRRSSHLTDSSFGAARTGSSNPADSLLGSSPEAASLHNAGRSAGFLHLPETRAGGFLNFEVAGVVGGGTTFATTFEGGSKIPQSVLSGGTKSRSPVRSSSGSFHSVSGTSRPSFPETVLTTDGTTNDPSSREADASTSLPSITEASSGGRAAASSAVQGGAGAGSPDSLVGFAIGPPPKGAKKSKKSQGDRRGDKIEQQLARAPPAALSAGGGGGGGPSAADRGCSMPDVITTALNERGSRDGTSTKSPNSGGSEQFTFGDGSNSTGVRIIFV